ncbi:MAG TPA: Ig-like domain-containing protein, partial [Terriglobales bacterium]|nr:Ig-like domain-containing protein [Terriglobales bacterium]
FGDNLAALVTGDVQLSGTGANTHGTDTLMGYALPIYGTSRTRGEVLLDWGGNYTGITAGHTNYQTECNAYEDGNLGGTYATTSNVPYQTSMMVQGVKELAWIRGPSWANYKLLRDLAYGWAKSSTANHQGMEDTGDWSTGGIRYGYPFNHTCNPNGPICPCQATYGARATVWMLWDYLWDYEGSTSGKSGFDLVLRKYMAVFPPASNTEWGQWGMSSTMYHYLHPTTTVASPAGVTTGLAMSTVSPLTVTNNGGGSYSLSFPAVSGATYAVKHASGKQIVDWLNFDIRYNNGTNNDCTVNVAPLTEACGTWGVDPTTHATWFGSNYTKEQTVSCPGSTCSITVTQDAANTALPSTGEQFMVKAFSGSGSPPPTDTTAPTVTITGPAPGNVSGTVSVTATATDPDDAVAGVQFKLDGVNLGAEDTSSPYSASWDTTTAVNGNHILSAVARDTNGNQNTATLAVVVVNNSGGGASATWTQICSGSTGPHPCPAPTWPYMRGYNYNLPYAPTRGTVLYYGGAGGGSSIYSNAVWEYNSNTHTANRISWTGTTDYVCNNIAGGGNGGSGSYGQFTAAPYFDGHPMGWFEVDTTRNQFFITGLLCQGYQMHHTWLLNLGNLTWSEAGSSIYPADITDSASIFVPWADVFISFGGAYGGSISNKLYYFHPASNTWTDETSGQTGIPNSGIGMVSGKFAADVANHVLYYFGGCKASDCSVGPFNTDIYTFNVATKAWTKLNPTGAGPAQGWQAPIWVWDSLRSRLITFSEGNVYAYTPSTNAWTPISTNAGPTTYAHSTSMGWNPSTEAQYDPGTDKVIFFDNAAVHGSLSGGGNADTPAIYELALGTGGGTTAYMVSVTIAGTGSGTVSDGLGFVCSSGTCGQQYNQGSNVTLTATATEGGSFAGWSGVDGGACPAGNTCTFNNLNAAKSVTATFNRPATAIRYSGVTVQGVKIQ